MQIAEPRYLTGDVVRHRRYDYRAVIIGADRYCKADELWYQNNRTQPDRNQPWYHVLDEDGGERYVAEENLSPDSAGGPLETPLVGLMFPTFHDGRYYRTSLN
jgi:hemimethylated DNA binding protein